MQNSPIGVGMSDTRSMVMPARSRERRYSSMLARLCAITSSSTARFVAPSARATRTPSYPSDR
jgi:hypothetical protein